LAEGLLSAAGLVFCVTSFAATLRDSPTRSYWSGRRLQHRQAVRV